jgi:uncharacterized membrane protein YcgQ (UPF0703/DUF1980 family)
MNTKICPEQAHARLLKSIVDAAKEGCVLRRRSGARGGFQPLGAHINEAMSKPEDLPRAEDGNAALEVTDLLYAETQEPLRRTITGKTVEVVGQYLGGANDQFKLVRMFIWCCAADARPIYVPVEASGPVDVSDMEWVKVTDTAEFSTNKGQTHVLLKAASVESSDPPEEAMFY